MSGVRSLVLCLAALGPGPAPPEDVPALREALYDRDHPRGQGQAALLLLQHTSPEAERIIRDGLRQPESAEVFLALADGVRLCRDGRFVEELLAALAAPTPAVRQAAGEALAALAATDLILRLRAVAESGRAEPAVRLAAVAALGRSGRQPAAAVLLDQLSDENPAVRRAAADALAELTGEPYGLDLAKWRRWWEAHKDVSEEQWLRERLAYQAARSARLAGDLDRARAQVVGLHQQLHARLPAADRLGHVAAVAEADAPAVRALAVPWALELLPAADALGQRTLANVLLRLSRDGDAEVQRTAVLALGRVTDPRAFDRLRALLGETLAPVRAAAVRALAQQGRGNDAEAQARRRLVVPALQKALDDPALEVVVEAAENLGALGVPEAGPVLTSLLRHPSEPVRQAAALALERVADGGVLDTLLDLLDDPAAKVRFSLVGALGHAAGDGKALSAAQREKLAARLEGLLRRDADPGVRSRAATVLGECGPPSSLAALWSRDRAGEDSRVQEKAWAAFVEVLARSASLELLQEWDQALHDAKQGPHRLQLLTELHARWQKSDETRALVRPTQELLIPAQLEQGKWAAALPLVREQLTRPGNDAQLDRSLRWLLAVGEQALKEGNHSEALRMVEEAQPFLTRRPMLAPEFEKLRRP